MGNAAEAKRRQPLGFLLLYALAQAGSVIAYTPFLMLVLPARVTELAGQDDVLWLGYIVFAGAVAASCGGVFFGWLSDRTGRRRVWILAGLLLSTGFQLAMVRCDDIAALLWLVVAWQLSLNMLLVPLLAWAADLVPDEQKGMLGGLLALAPASGAWSGIALAASGATTFQDKLWVIAFLAIAAVLPVLCFGRPRQSSGPAIPVRQSVSASPRLGSVAMRVWAARLLVQISGAALASYLYFWLRALDPAMGDGEKTVLFAGGLTAAIFLAFVVGRWTDRHGRPFAMLSLLAVISAAGLGAMALAGDPATAKSAYLLFATTGATFLALHASQTLRILPDPDRRGRDIGIFNLANTAPSLVMPWLAISLVPAFGFERLFLLLALLALAAAALLATIPRDV
ncbi:MFS transporter [Sphingomonas sp. So64.6b]|uniref:MFS transporter n=1 Tax=Sphingomonas sp. So64.6b TaxID=2997354 RepID=UPI0016037D3E|nr:MFS transporter [Sphingomonas sp. So64.6b]QNA84167.1 MFS transporter [Sphingomonas sp. So64.6b]